jgi:hypothetical protein
MTSGCIRRIIGDLDMRFPWLSLETVNAAIFSATAH